MNIQTSVKTCFNKYATFSGRARRSELWWFLVFLILASVVFSVLDLMLGLGVLSIAFSLATVIPAYAVGARRLHDIDKSGWWQLIILVPLIGAILLIVWYAKEGSTVENRFGAPAKTVSEFDVAD